MKKAVPLIFLTVAFLTWAALNWAMYENTEDQTGECHADTLTIKTHRYETTKN